MLTRLEIENFRGIRSGAIDQLTPLTVLVGRNGQGKSTVLEAAYLFARAPDVRALYTIAKRRGWYGPATWQFLFPTGASRGTPGEKTSFAVTGVLRQDDVARKLRVTGSIRTSAAGVLGESDAQSSSAPNDIELFLTVNGDVGEEVVSSRAVVSGAATITEVQGSGAIEGLGTNVIEGSALVDAARLSATDAESMISRATLGGTLEISLEYSKRVIPGLTDIRLVQLSGRTVAMLYFGGGQKSVPIYAAGDGQRKIVDLALGLIGGPAGLIALEEPENFLHPGAQDVCVELIWAAIERGEQIILSTHSLDFIDDLMKGRSEEDLAQKMSVHRTRLEDGKLETVRYTGTESRDARDLLGADLRREAR